jgi:tetratricopeptide (TPR) repeat protein
VIAACGRDDREALVVALRVRGWAERELYRYSEARASFASAARVARRHGMADRLAEVLISRSGLNLEIGRTDSAQRDSQAARAALVGRSTVEIESQDALLAMVAGDHARAVDLGQRGRRMVNAATDPIVATVLLVNLGESLSYVGRWSDAQAVFREAETAARTLGRYYLGLVFQIRAAAAVRCGHLIGGLTDFDRAEQLLVEAGWPLGEHYLERIDCFVALRLLDEAEDAVARGVRYADEGGMGLMLSAGVRLRQARQLREAGRHAEAERVAKVAAELFRRQRRSVYAAQAELIRLGARHASGAAGPQDLRAARRVARTLERAGTLAESIDAKILIAGLLTEAGRASEARRHLAGAHAASLRGGMIVRLKGCYAAALLATIDGDAPGIGRAARRGLHEVSAMRATLPTSELRALASGHGVDLAVLGLRSALRTRRVSSVFEWIERGRLASALSESPRRRDAECDRLTEKLREVAVAQRAGGDDVERARGLRDEQARLEQRLQRRLRNLNPRAAGATRPITAGELSRLLPGSLLEVATVDRQLVAITLGATRQIADLGSEADAIREVQALQFALRRVLRARNDPSRDSARQSIRHSLQQLDAQLVRPLVAALAEQVLVAPPAPLFAVPWHALPSLASRRVSVTPSATLWARAQRTRPRRGGVPFIAAGPRLNAAVAEVAAIAELYRGAGALTPPASSVAAVRDGLRRSQMAHLACHGSFRSDNPGFSTLEWSDGPLTVLDLESVGRTPDTVILASCDSGASQALPGDELRGFLTALFMMGTRSVVASAVPVPDVDVMPFMVALHRRLASGDAIGAAIDHARAEIDPDVPEGLVIETAFAHYGCG